MIVIMRTIMSKISRLALLSKAKIAKFNTPHQDLSIGFICVPGSSPDFFLFWLNHISSLSCGFPGSSNAWWSLGAIYRHMFNCSSLSYPAGKNSWTLSVSNFYSQICLIRWCLIRQASSFKSDIWALCWRCNDSLVVEKKWRADMCQAGERRGQKSELLSELLFCRWFICHAVRPAPFSNNIHSSIQHRFFSIYFMKH